MNIITRLLIVIAGVLTLGVLTPSTTVSAETTVGAATEVVSVSPSAGVPSEFIAYDHEPCGVWRHKRTGYGWCWGDKYWFGRFQCYSPARYIGPIKIGDAKWYWVRLSGRPNDIDWVECNPHHRPRKFSIWEAP